jgi:hypothetical protein
MTGLNQEKIPYENRTLLWLRRRQESVALDRKLIQIANEVDATQPDCPTAPRATLPGDSRRLRGIPVVGARGVGGAIPGTLPHSIRD